VTKTADQIVAEIRSRFEQSRKSLRRAFTEVERIRRESYGDALGEMLEWVTDGDLAALQDEADAKVTP
jgi:predicted phage gp36 major capsid-like protein